MTRLQQSYRVIAVGLFAFAMGIVNSLMGVDGSALLSALSRTVAPWLLLAFVAGAYAHGRRTLPGALSGFLATMLALIGFYFTNSVVFHFGPQTFPSDVTFAAQSGRVYFVLGLFSGPLLGAFGAWWRQHLSMIPVVLVGMLFILEGLARASLNTFFAYYASDVAAIEILIGLAWIAVALTTTRALRNRTGSRTI
jgi:Family of unknown function (DUF6518)